MSFMASKMAARADAAAHGGPSGYSGFGGGSGSGGGGGHFFAGGGGRRNYQGGAGGKRNYGEMDADEKAKISHRYNKRIRQQARSGGDGGGGGGGGASRNFWDFCPDAATIEVAPAQKGKGFDFLGSVPLTTTDTEGKVHKVYKRDDAGEIVKDADGEPVQAMASGVRATGYYAPGIIQFATDEGVGFRANGSGGFAHQFSITLMYGDVSDVVKTCNADWKKAQDGTYAFIDACADALAKFIIDKSPSEMSGYIKECRKKASTWRSEIKKRAEARMAAAKKKAAAAEKAGKEVPADVTADLEIALPTDADEREQYHMNVRSNLQVHHEELAPEEGGDEDGEDGEDAVPMRALKFTTKAFMDVDGEVELDPDMVAYAKAYPSTARGQAYQTIINAANAAATTAPGPDGKPVKNKQFKRLNWKVAQVAAATDTAAIAKAGEDADIFVARAKPGDTGHAFGRVAAWAHEGQAGISLYIYSGETLVTGNHEFQERDMETTNMWVPKEHVNTFDAAAASSAAPSAAPAPAPASPNGGADGNADAGADADADASGTVGDVLLKSIDASAKADPGGDGWVSIPALVKQIPAKYTPADASASLATMCDIKVIEKDDTGMRCRRPRGDDDEAKAE